ncbi:MAG: exodeoxyribonuclease VII small subunit [Rhodospirillales bacterium]
MAKKTIPADIAKMSFEEALSELEDIVRRLEGGKDDLEKSIKAYLRGADLKNHCEAKLQEAKSRVEKIVLGPENSISAKPLGMD